MKIIYFYLLFFSGFYVLADFSFGENGFEQHSASKNSYDDTHRHHMIRKQLEVAKTAWDNKNFSDYLTSDLVKMMLIADPSSFSGEGIRKELIKRPEEVRSVLLEKLNEQSINFDVLYGIPYIAGLVDTDFQVEISKRCLFRKEMRDADMSLQIQESMGSGIYSLIAKSKNDETAVLDQLIDEGRLEPGSEFEVKWRKLLAADDQKKKNNHQHDPINSDKITKNSVEKSDIKPLSNSNYFFFGTIILVFVSIILYLKFFKGSVLSARRK
jgi:hypothetical protein